MPQKPITVDVPKLPETEDIEEVVSTEMTDEDLLLLQQDTYKRIDQDVDNSLKELDDPGTLEDLIRAVVIQAAREDRAFVFKKILAEERPYIINTVRLDFEEAIRNRLGVEKKKVEVDQKRYELRLKELEKQLAKKQLEITRLRKQQKEIMMKKRISVIYVVIGASLVALTITFLILSTR